MSSGKAYDSNSKLKANAQELNREVIPVRVLTTQGTLPMITNNDRTVIRELAAKWMEWAADPVMEERKRAWRPYTT